MNGGFNGVTEEAGRNMLSKSLSSIYPQLTNGTHSLEMMTVLMKLSALSNMNSYPINGFRPFPNTLPHSPSTTPATMSPISTQSLQSLPHFTVSNVSNSDSNHNRDQIGLRLSTIPPKAVVTRIRKRKKKYDDYIECVDQEFQCKTCQKLYRNYRAATDHYVRYHTREPVKCDYCSYKTFDPKYIYSHKYHLHGIPIPESSSMYKLKCPHCHHIAKTSFYLNNHISKKHLEAPHS